MCWASVAELVDALDSKSSAVRRAGSIPAGGTTYSHDAKKPALFLGSAGFLLSSLSIIKRCHFNTPISVLHC
jgi:hypothetical protein